MKSSIVILALLTATVSSRDLQSPPDYSGQLIADSLFDFVAASPNAVTDTFSYNFDTAMEGWGFTLAANVMQEYYPDPLRSCLEFSRNVVLVGAEHTVSWNSFGGVGALSWTCPFSGWYTNTCNYSWRIKSISVPVPSAWEGAYRIEARLNKASTQTMYAMVGYKMWGDTIFSYTGWTTPLRTNTWDVVTLTIPDAMTFRNLEAVSILLGAYSASGIVYVDWVRGYKIRTSHVIHVPADQATIQAGINAASNGDTVLVSPGIYYENLDFLDRNIVLGSNYLLTTDTGFISSTIIDGNDTGNAIKINGGQDSTSKVSGFTIRNGVGGLSAGGGVYCGGNSQTTIEHNIIENNQDGGLCAYSANPRIQHNVIRNNTSAGPGAVEGGGIYCYSVSSTIKNNLIVGNHATFGGGIFYYFSSCAIENNTIVSNSATNGGGGIYYWSSSSASVQNNIVWSNTGDQIAVASASPLVTYCDVQGSWPGTGNIAYDPLFLNPVAGEFRLRLISPCVDSGNPSPLFNDPDGSRNDIGAFPLGVSPVLNVIGAKAVAEGELLVFRLTASDPDLTTPTLIAANTPSGSLFVDSANGAGSFSWTPSHQQSGSHEVLFIASDGVLADSELVSITVTNVIRPPEVTALTIDGSAQHQNLINHQPPFRWNYVDAEALPQTRFEIGVGSDNEWTYSEIWNPAPFTSPDTFVIYNGTPLVDGQVCYLRLRVFNGTLWSSWYETTFRMNSIPSTPMQIRPIANSVAATSTPTLWVQNATDPEGDLLTYEFDGFHDTDCVAGPPIVLTGVASGSDSTGGQIITPLAENCRYWWMARAYDGHEYGSWTNLSTFFVNGTQEPPSAFALKSPVDSGLWPEFNMLPTCIWNQSYDPDPFDTILYKLELSDRANFSFAYVKDSLTGPQFTLTDSLYFGTRYYWRVTAKDRTSLQTISPVRDFWTWKPGDADHSHTVDISDLMTAVDFLVSGIPITPLFVGDFNGDCTVDISDIMYVVDFLTGAGPAAKAECTL